MNKIVREHYPTAKLPADLRGGLAEGAEAEVTIVVTEAEAPSRRSLAEIIAQRPISGRSKAEVDTALATERDSQ